jgi:hypothetical protein
MELFHRAAGSKLANGECLPRHFLHVRVLVAERSARLKADGLWPGCDAPVWAIGCWRVYLNTPEEAKRAVVYVEANPEKESKPRQQWSFVRPYEC